MSKKSVGLSLKAYETLVMYRGSLLHKTGRLFSMSEAIEDAINKAHELEEKEGKR